MKRLKVVLLAAAVGVAMITAAWSPRMLHVKGRNCFYTHISTWFPRRTPLRFSVNMLGALLGSAYQRQRCSWPSAASPGD